MDSDESATFSEWPEGFYMTPTEVDEMLAPFNGDAWMFANEGAPVPDYLPESWQPYPGGDYLD